MPRVVQLALEETDPGLWHGHDVVVPTDTGYRGCCACGWVSDTLPDKAKARGAVSSHLARTPAGRRVVATLRRTR